MAASNSSAGGNVQMKSFMESIIQSNTHLFRTISLLTALAVIICSIIYFSFRSLASNKSDVLVQTTDKGFSLQIKKNDGTESNVTLYSFLLPSNDWWYNTGIRIKPNDICKLKISGRIHLALHKLVKSAEDDLPSPVEWCGPGGNQWSLLGVASAQDDAKRELLLYPGDKKLIGNVVGVFLSETEIGNFKKTFTSDRKKWTNNIVPIGEQYTYTNVTGKDVVLYLAVNDILFDFAGKERSHLTEVAYKGNQPDPRYEDAWKKISEPGKEYIQLWYEDNIGSFLVQAELKSSKD